MLSLVLRWLRGDELNTIICPVVSWAVKHGPCPQKPLWALLRLDAVSATNLRNLVAASGKYDPTISSQRRAV